MNTWPCCRSDTLKYLADFSAFIQSRVLEMWITALGAVKQSNYL